MRRSPVSWLVHSFPAPLACSLVRRFLLLPCFPADDSVFTLSCPLRFRQDELGSSLRQRNKSVCMHASTLNALFTCPSLIVYAAAAHLYSSQAELLIALMF